MGVSQGGWPWDLTRRRLRGAAHPSTQPSTPEGPAHSTQAVTFCSMRRRGGGDGDGRTTSPKPPRLAQMSPPGDSAQSPVGGFLGSPPNMQIPGPRVQVQGAGGPGALGSTCVPAPALAAADPASRLLLGALPTRVCRGDRSGAPTSPVGHPSAVPRNETPPYDDMGGLEGVPLSEESQTEQGQ